MNEDNREQQWRIANIALDASRADSFALAGSGAIREHGLIDRPTEDVDLFTIQNAQTTFEPAVNHVEKALRDAGYLVKEDTRLPGFARLAVEGTKDGYTTDIDMGIDWRASAPVNLRIGPVLDIKDAVSSKVTALYSRGEARDYLDVDSIRCKGPFSDYELVSMAQSWDQGFELDMFRQALEHVQDIAPGEVTVYKYNAEQLGGVKKRLLDFARQIAADDISHTRTNTCA